MAGMLMVWGVILLKRESSNSKKSKGWLMLAVPCPVCLVVIFFSAGFLITCFPDTPKTAVLILYLVFILINLITIAILTRLQHKRKAEPEFLLGAIMLFIAVYFFVSVTVMPQFADIDTIYRMAKYKDNMPPKEIAYRIPFIIFIVSAFVGGYSFKFKKTRSAT
jgi:predicted transporter